MQASDIFRTATFKTSLLSSAGFAAGTLLLFAFIYWQTAIWETARIEGFLLHESQAIAREPPEAITRDVSTRFTEDLHRKIFAAVFDSALRPLAGELAAYPKGLPYDNEVHSAKVQFANAGALAAENVRAVARTLPDGRILVLGRSDLDLEELRAVVLRGLGLGLLPALALALGAGAFASMRALDRVQGINDCIARIMTGHLHERLESRATGDVLDQLAAGVNRMLDEIERLIEEVQGVGDDIAHDLRTPLTRMRARLERGRATAATHESLQGVVDLAVRDLDQAVGTIAALLRIGQIEAGARHAAFTAVSLDALAGEAADFYRPLAEERGITLALVCGGNAVVSGDRDLLFEALVNLLDNALKFTPAGGMVTIGTSQTPLGPVLSVRDNGPGIPPHERSRVLKRFHRADRSRNVPGSGLGLSLIAVIVRLHGFQLVLGDAHPGLSAELLCWAA